MIRAGRGEERGKVRLRFVEFELEGLSSTIEESIKSIVGSMNRSNGGILPSRQHTDASATAHKLPAPDAQSISRTGSDEVLDTAQTENGDEESISMAAKSPRHYTQPKFLEDFDLDTGDKAFKVYSNEINPETDNHRYLVIAAWSKHFRALDCITIDHVYTCYQKMGWKSQKDVGQPFRKMKRSSLFQNPARGQWKITHIGLDRVQHGPSEGESAE